jgi:hypothetical protein
VLEGVLSTDAEEELLWDSWVYVCDGGEREIEKREREAISKH